MILVYCTGHCTGWYRDVGGGGSVVRKIFCTGPWKKLMYIKLPMDPLIDTALYVLLDTALYVEK